MQSVAEIIAKQATPYKGSAITRSMVEEEVKRRWGEEELKNLDCYHNLRTFQSWKKLGFKVRKSEKAIRSITYIEDRDGVGNIIRRYRKPVFLFYVLQTEKIK